MKNTLKLAAAAALIALLPSCTQMTPSGTETIPQARVKLTENNYRVLATRVSAEDKGFSLLPIAGTAAKVITLGAFNHVIPNGLGRHKNPLCHQVTVDTEPYYDSVRYYRL